jgi:hypothetical protein
MTGIPSLIGQVMRMLEDSPLVNYQIYTLLLRECVPLLNPCFTIFFVRAYRERFLNMFL